MQYRTIALILAAFMMPTMHALAQNNKDGKDEFTCKVKVVETDFVFSGASAHYDKAADRFIVLGAGKNKYTNGKFQGWEFEKTALFGKETNGNFVLSRLVESKQESPIPRSYISAALNTTTQKVIMFGGFNPEFFKDLWTFDLKTSTWTQKQNGMDDSWPLQRDAHASCVDEKNGNFLLFGGLNKKGVRNDLWIWDAKTLKWIEKKAHKTDPWPSLRLTHRMAALPGRKVLMFGGLNPGFQSLNELWSLDLGTLTWQKLKSGPKDLAGAAIVWHPKLKRLIVLGGSQARKAQDYILSYDPATDSWQSLGQLMQPIAHAAASYDSKADRILLFGGTTGIFMADHPKHMIQEVTIKRSK